MRSNIFLGLLVLLLATMGCRSTRQVIADYEKDLLTGHYAHATNEVASLVLKDDESHALWSLMAGSAYTLAQDPAQGCIYFDEAEDVMKRLDQSLSLAKGGEKALATLTNERALPYEVSPHERIFVSLYKAINYLGQNRLNAARTELNRAHYHQDLWLSQHERTRTRATERLKKQVEGYAKQNNGASNAPPDRVQTVLANTNFAQKIQEKCNYNPAMKLDIHSLVKKDYINTYALHVAGLFRWLMRDGGRAYLKETMCLAPNTSALFDFQEADKGLRVKNQIWIWAEDGLAPKRTEWRLDLPLALVPELNHYVLYAGMALPVLTPCAHAAEKWLVQTGSETREMDLLTDVDQLMRTEYEIYMQGALPREMTRAIVKAGAQVALGIAAENASDGNARLAFRLAQIAAAAFAASSTAADERCWTALPKRVYVQRVARPADGHFSVWADAQRLDFNVPEGNALIFIRKTGPLAPPVVTQAILPND